MAVLVSLVNFYTVLVIEKKTKFSTESPRKHAILTPKSQKILGKGMPPTQTPPLWGREHTLPPLAPSAFDLTHNINSCSWPMSLHKLLLFLITHHYVFMNYVFSSRCLCATPILLYATYNLL